MSFPENLAIKEDDATRDRIEEAGRICRSVLAQTPDDVTYLQLMGVIECKLNRFDESEAWFRKCLAQEPDSPEILCSYAMALIMAKRFERAIPLLERAVEIKPDFTLALHHLGNAYKENGVPGRAVPVYERLLALKPDDVEIMYNLALMAKEGGNLRAAMAYCERAVIREPSNPFCVNNLGIICYMTGDYRGAANCYRKALELKPDYPEALSNLGMLMREAGAFEQAVDLSSRALALRPQYPEALNNLGVSLMDNGRLGEAIQTLRHAARLNDTDPETQYNLSLALLASGEFEEGWRLHESRGKTSLFKDAHREYPQPLWSGEAAPGRILFVHCEQGMGDMLQFCRYAPMAAARGLRVVLQVQRPLVRLVKSLEGVATVMAFPEEPADFDFHCPMMTLPMIFDTRLESIPYSGPYLSAIEKEAPEWDRRIALVSNGKVRVGLVWAGSACLHSPSLAMTDRRRSVSPEMLAPLVKVENIDFFSLQKDGAKAPKELGLIDLMDACNDFADTAALVSNLELVITVDTAVAHLAGAIGKPVWVMNRFDSCWRWLRERETTPWYSTMRLFNQPEAGDWVSVIGRIAAELKKTFGPSPRKIHRH